MKILIIGTNGKSGQALLSQLSQTDHQITTLIRDPEQEITVNKFSAKFILGDLEKNISELANDFDAIMFVAGSRGKNVEGVDYQGLVKMVDSTVKANVKRFLYIGSINTSKKPEQYIKELIDFYEKNNELAPEGLLKNTENTRYYNYVKLKELAEKHLIESNLNYTILRAGLLTQDSGTGKVTATLGSLNAFGKISRETLAKYFIEALDNKNTYRRIYTILNGETPINQAFTDSQ